MNIVRWLRRPTAKAALSLITLAAAVFLWWRWADVDRLDAWVPNIVVGLVALAATITFVEWIIRREEQARSAPWRDRLISDLRVDLFMFSQSAALDYAFTHLRWFKQPPDDVIELLGFWLAEKGNQDICQVRPPEMPISTIVYYGHELAANLRRYRDRDLAVMDPELVRAIDDITGIGGAESLTVPEMRAVRADWVKGSEISIVQRVRKLADVLMRCDPEHFRLSVGGPLMDGLEAHSKRMLEWRYEAPESGPRHA